MFKADQITSERRTRRAASFWRIVAILALMSSFVGIFLNSAKTSSRIGKYSDHVARLRIDGFISGDQKVISLLTRIEKSTRAKAVIIRINSPGGTTVGSEALYEALRKISKKKPVIAVMDSVAASGGYIAALGTDHIVARGNTITGSIGVIFQWPEVGKLMNTIGVNMQTIKSGPQKAEPNMYQPLKADVREVLEQSVEDSFIWFKGLVKERRKLSDADTVRLSDGRIYTGRQALKENLIDAIGGEDVGLAWLHKTKKISTTLKILDWEVPSVTEKVGLSLSLLQGSLKAIGLGKLAHDLAPALQNNTRNLDGLLVVWQPAIK